MQVVEGWASLAERVGPTLLVPVGAAVVVTILWALTGWAWFDLGPWPWALGAVPIALLGVQRLVIALGRHQRATRALGELALALRRLGRSMPSEDSGLALAAVWLTRARFGRDGLHDLSGGLSTEDLVQVRSAEDPLACVLDLCVSREPASDDAVEDVWAAITAVEIAAVTSPTSPIPSMALTTLFLATMPVGLVTTTGWWTPVAIAGIALAYLAVEVVTESVHRPLIGANAAPADEILAITEQSLARRAGR